MIAKLLRPLSVRVVVLAIVYFALAYVNLAFFTFGQYDSFPTIWIPSGVALAVLLLTPRREWAAYLAGIFAASILAHSLNNTLLWLAICYSFISVLECTSAALLFQRFTDEKVSFQKLRETAIFVTVSALPASVLSAGLKIAVFCVAFPGVDFFIRWAGWSAAFYIGMIVITPLLVSTNYLLRKEFKASVAYVFERVAILLLVGVLAFAIFGDVGLGSPHSLPFFFLPFPVLIFAATRFGVAGACWISALLAVEAVLVISQTRNSLGYLYVSWHQKIWWLQSYVATASLSTMILAVLTTEGRKTRESLQSSEERLRILVQDMPVMFDAFDGDGLIVAWNKECERVTGYSASEVIGNENIVVSMYPDEEYRQRMIAEWETCVGNYRNWEWDVTCKDGNKKIIAWSSISAVNPLPGWASWGVGVDITERKKAERIIREQTQELHAQKEELSAQNEQLLAQTQELLAQEAILRDSEARLNRSQSVANVGSWELDLATMKTWASPEAFRIYGLKINSEQSLPLVDVQKVPLGEERPRLDAALHNLIANNIPYHIDYRIRRVDDEELRYVHSRAELVRDAQGRAVKVLGTLQDITERKLVEEKLAQTQALLLASIEQSPAGIMVADAPDVHVRLMNRAAEEILMMERERHYAVNLDNNDIIEWVCYRADGSRYEVAELPLPQTILSGTTVGNVEIRVVRSDGSERWILSNSAPIRDADGNITAGVIVFLDITERKRIENALYESEERYRTLFNAESDAIFLIDGESGQILDANLAALQMYGYTYEELMQRKNTDISAEPSETRRHLEQKSEHVALRWHRKKDGTVFPTEITASNIELGGRKIHIAAIRNISKRLEIESALSESEERFRLLTQEAPFGMALLDGKGGILYINNQFTRITGYTLEDIPRGEEWYAKAYPDDSYRKDVESGYYENIELIKNELPVPMRVLRVRCKDGSDKQIRHRMVLFPDEKILVTMEDITEQKHAEDTLQKQRAYLEALYETILGVIDRLKLSDLLYSIVSRATTLVGVNNGFIFLVNVEKDCLELRFGIGYFKEYINVPLRKGEGLSGKVWETGKALALDDYSVWDNKADGFTGIPLHAIAAFPLVSGGQVVGVIGVGHVDVNGTLGKNEIELLSRFAQLASVALDNAKLYEAVQQELAERRKAEREVLLLNAELEQRVLERTAQLEAANREMEAFSYSVSHDLRAPLRSIDGFSQMLYEDYYEQLDETGKYNLQRVRAGAQRMGDLIEDLLQLSRLTRGEIHRAYVDISALVLTVVEEMRKQDDKRQVEFIVQSGLTANVDEHLIQIVLENLIGNAWKFTARRAQARIEFGALKQENGLTAYFVRDNGAGFNMVYVNKLFGAFQRLHSDKEFPGTGVGLATVQRIIHRHGGEVWAEAEEGKGATFFFTLPE